MSRSSWRLRSLSAHGRAVSALGHPRALDASHNALGAFTFTMDTLPGTPQIQNIIPTSFFKIDFYTESALGIIGAIFVFASGIARLE